MTNRMKEEERIERMIRGLLKLQENRRCVNCNNLGPQYVCITFNTFVCVNCSGIHREFTHRVKSISMAKFNSEEVTALQAGGNERAREFYFKGWNPERNSYPDGSNLYRLRDFIKHVYVDRKYAGGRIAENPIERSNEKISKLRLAEKDGFNEGRKQNASRSQSYEDLERSFQSERSEDRSFRLYYDERRSPRCASNSSKSGGGGLKKSPARFEVVDDRFKDDGFGSRRQPEIRRITNRESNVGNKSPEPQKSIDQFTSPVVGDSCKEKGRNHIDYNQSQHFAFSVNLGSIEGNQTQIEAGNPGSLIDLNTESSPSNPVVAQIQQTSTASSSELSVQKKSIEAPIPNTLEYLLFELSVPSLPSINEDPPTPARCMLTSEATRPPQSLVEHDSTLCSTVSESRATTRADMFVQPSNEALLTAVPTVAFISPVKVSDGELMSNVQQNQHSASPLADSSSTVREATMSFGAIDNQPWTASHVPTWQVSSHTFAKQSSTEISVPTEESSGVELKSTARMELPADLFTTTYSSTPAPYQGWQSYPPHGMGYSIQQYPNSMPVPSYPNIVKSANPFDLHNEATGVHSSFPSMPDLQGANCNILVPIDVLHNSHPSEEIRHSPSYASGLPAGGHVGKQAQFYISPSGSQDVGGAPDIGGGGGVTFIYSQTSPTCYPSAGGNPFG